MFAYKVSAHGLLKVCQPCLIHMYLEQIMSHRHIAIKITLFFNVVHEPRIHYEFSGRNSLYRVFNLKVDRILIWAIYLLRFTTCYITQLTCIYSTCWKWRPFISMHLSTYFTMSLATFLSVLSFTSSMAWVIFIFKILNFSKKLCLQRA